VGDNVTVVEVNGLKLTVRKGWETDPWSEGQQPVFIQRYRADTGYNSLECAVAAQKKGGGGFESPPHGDLSLVIY